MSSHFTHYLDASPSLFHNTRPKTSRAAPGADTKRQEAGRQQCAMATGFFLLLSTTTLTTHTHLLSSAPSTPITITTHRIQRRQTGMADPQDSEEAFCAAREAKRAATWPIHNNQGSVCLPFNHHQPPKAVVSG